MKEEKKNLTVELSKAYYLEIFNSKKAVLTGDAEIIKYSDTTLKVKCGNELIAFSGNKFKIKEYCGENIALYGEICGISFEKGEKCL